jgi:integrase
VAAYRRDVLPLKASATQQGNEVELTFLMRFFDVGNPAPLDEIQPVHIRQYMRWRVNEARRLALAKHPDKPVSDTIGQVRANQEKALFSHIWNYARGEGLTAMTNPCAGIKGYREEGRDTAPDDALVQRVYETADQPLRFALRLAELTGQRPTDVRTMHEGQISSGELHIKQGKTGARLRIVIEGALAQLLDEIAAYKEQVYAQHSSLVRSNALLVTEQGRTPSCTARWPAWIAARSR